MKKRFLQIATAVSAATMLAACSQTDLIDDGSVKNDGTADNNAVTFSTYTSKKGGTRADEVGKSGNMTSETLRSSDGFGVFAYYTGTKKYGDYQGYENVVDGPNKPKEAAAHEPNFMYNQQVKYETNKWTYSPLKYWPNDFQGGNVDGETPPAQGSGTNGGYVSFFAYAPYVTYSAAKGNATGTGITGMTSNETAGDPTITYTLGSNIDLLWGTLDVENTAHNVVGDEDSNIGVSGETTTGTTSNDYYQSEIVTDRTVAANLTKQKIGDKVAFNFIHALAGIGGSTETVNPDYKETEETKTEKNYNSGFKVVLDIDNKKGAATNNRETFYGEDGEQGDKSDTHYRTIVTIEKVSIKNIVKSSTGNSGDSSSGEGGTQTETGALHTSGTLNLATGKWSHTGSTTQQGSSTFEQNIGTTTTDNSEMSEGVNLELNKNLAEFVLNDNNTLVTNFENMTDSATATNNTKVKDYFAMEDGHVGVTEKQQNVYENAKVPAFFLFPDDKPIFEVSVTYVVRQYDENLNKAHTYVRNTITKEVEFPVTLAMNTHYTLIMHLGLTSVHFTAVVAPWSEYTPEGGNTGDDDDDDDDNDDPDYDTKGVEIYLPSNDVAPQKP